MGQKCCHLRKTKFRSPPVSRSGLRRLNPYCIPFLTLSPSLWIDNYSMGRIVSLYGKCRGSSRDEYTLYYRAMTTEASTHYRRTR